MGQLFFLATVLCLNW